jgi:cation transport ATPase
MLYQHARTLSSRWIFQNRRLQCVAVSPVVATQATELAAPGRTVIPIAIDQQMTGLLVLEDALRPDGPAHMTVDHRHFG